eukprot:592733-Pyramimonas_sp.AAC.1
MLHLWAPPGPLVLDSWADLIRFFDLRGQTSLRRMGGEGDHSTPMQGHTVNTLYDETLRMRWNRGICWHARVHNGWA